MDSGVVIPSFHWPQIAMVTVILCFCRCAKHLYGDTLTIHSYRIVIIIIITRKSSHRLHFPPRRLQSLRRALRWRDQDWPSILTVHQWPPNTVHQCPPASSPVHDDVTYITWPTSDQWPDVNEWTNYQTSQQRQRITIALGGGNNVNGAVIIAFAVCRTVPSDHQPLD